MDTIKIIKSQIKNNPVLIYIKGTPKLPSCGFSSQAIEILLKCNIKFKYINILKYPNIRKELPKYANWPTFPQLWVNGILIGGCDIIMEMFKNGKLVKLINK